MRQEKMMYFARMMRDPLDSQTERTFETYEYAVVGDADVVGELKTGPFDFRVWEMGTFGVGQQRWLCLRFRYPMAEIDERSEQLPRPLEMSKRLRQSAFYHGGGPAEEVVALASVLFRRRLKLGPQVRLGDNPVMVRWDEISRRLDPYRLGEINVADSASWFESVANLDPKYHLAFILAARLYQEALWQLETSPDLAYINLVTAIEGLSFQSAYKPKSIGEYDPALESLILEIQDYGLRNRLADHLLESYKPDRIRVRWTRFIMDHIEPSFWSERRLPEELGEEPSDAQLWRYGFVTGSSLEVLLDRIYEQRSRSLHEGRPFPPWITESGWGRDLPMGLARSSGGGVWTEEDYFPHFHFFERLVRHVLINFVARNQTSSGQTVTGVKPLQT